MPTNAGCEAPSPARSVAVQWSAPSHPVITAAAVVDCPGCARATAVGDVVAVAVIDIVDDMVEGIVEDVAAPAIGRPCMANNPASSTTVATQRGAEPG